MALSTFRKCSCHRPHGYPGDICWTCERRIEGSLGSDDHSYQDGKTYTEPRGHAFGYSFKAGRDTGAVAMPGGDCKSAVSTGKDWYGTMVLGGSSNLSYAYAGKDDMIACAAKGGHAVSISGSGNSFEAKVMGPGGQVIHRLPDGTITRRESTTTEKIYPATKYGDKHYKTLDYDNGQVISTKHKDRDRKATKHGKKEQKAIEYHKKYRRDRVEYLEYV